MWQELRTELYPDLEIVTVALDARGESAARLWIDKIIDPVGTRDAIVLALEAAALNPDVPEFKVGVLQT